MGSWRASLRRSRSGPRQRHPVPAARDRTAARRALARAAAAAGAGADRGRRAAGRRAGGAGGLRQDDAARGVERARRAPVRLGGARRARQRSTPAARVGPARDRRGGGPGRPGRAVRARARRRAGAPAPRRDRRPRGHRPRSAAHGDAGDRLAHRAAAADRADARPALRDRARAARARDDQGGGRGADEGRAPRGRARGGRSAPGPHGGMAGRPLARVPLPRRPGRRRRRVVRRHRPPGGAVPARRGAPRPPAGRAGLPAADLHRRHPHGAAVRRARGPSRRGGHARRPGATRAAGRARPRPTSATAITACSPTRCARSSAPWRAHRERELHRLAGAWHRGAGEIDLAIEHALGAGDVAAAGELVWESLAPLVAAGRTSTVERWLGRFLQSDIAEHPALALTAAGCALLRGQGQMAAHWTAAAAAADGCDPAIQAGVATFAAPSPARPLACSPPRRRRRDGRPRGLPADRRRGAPSRGRRRRCRGGARGGRALRGGVRAGDPRPLPRRAGRARARRGRLGARRRRTRRARGPRSTATAWPTMPRWRWCSPSPRWCARAAAGSTPRGSDLRDAGARCSRSSSTSRPAAEAEVALVLARAALRQSDVNLGREQLARARRLLRPLPGAVTLQRWAAEVTAQLERLHRRRRRRPRLDHGGGAADPPVPADPSLVPGDRRADLRLGQHGQDAGQRRLPQARGLVPLRRGRARPRLRAARRRPSDGAGLA